MRAQGRVRRRKVAKTGAGFDLLEGGFRGLGAPRGRPEGVPLLIINFNGFFRRRPRSCKIPEYIGKAGVSRGMGVDFLSGASGRGACLNGLAPNVFDYLNYHAFLKAFYEMRKARNAFFSYRYLGKVLNLDAGFLVKVLQGKLALPVKCLPPLVKLCGFQGREADYLRELVLYGRAKTPKDIKLRFENMIALRDQEPRKVETDQYAFYQKWYHSAMHCLLMFHDFKGDFKALAARLTPALTVKEAKESVQLLENLGFVRRREDGGYEVTDARLTTGDKWQSVAIRNFQEECWRLAGESWARHAKEIRDMSTVTITLSRKNLDEVKARVKELRQSLLHLVSEGDKPDAVYQVNIQVFPLALVDGDGEAA